jgi:hypothetical protein
MSGPSSLSVSVSDSGHYRVELPGARRFVPTRETTFPARAPNLSQFP